MIPCANLSVNVCHAMPPHIPSERAMKSAYIKCMAMEIKDKRSKRVQLKRFNLSRAFKVIKKLFISSDFFPACAVSVFFHHQFNTDSRKNESQK